MSDIKMTKLANCAGCGAKVAAGELSKLLKGLPLRNDPNLMVGFDKSDDAAVYKINNDIALIQTIDFFPPIADDPYDFGRIAATNALSDVFAMGGEPKLALNVLCVSPEMKKEHVQELLRGGYEKAYEAGAIITGGHSIQDKEPKYGLSVTGFANPKNILTNSNAKAGDILILTKPLGIGIMSTAGKAGEISNEERKLIVEIMTTLNKKARDIMVKYKVNSCTDVTGFGLLGHSLEMAKGSEKTIEIFCNNVPVIDSAFKYAKGGFVPGGMHKNKKYAFNFVNATIPIESELEAILYDPQTSGGLLISVACEDANKLQEELAQNLPCASIIGQVTEKKDKPVYLL